MKIRFFPEKPILIFWYIFMVSIFCYTVDLRFEPAEIYVGEGTEFSIDVYMDTGSDSLRDYQLDFIYNSYTIDMLTVESGTEIFPPDLMWESADAPNYFIVYASDSEGIDPVDNYHLITFSFKARFQGGSRFKMIPFSGFDKDYHSLCLNGPQPALIHVARPGELWGDVNGDGYVQILDAFLTAQFYAGREPEGFIREVSDVNCDSEINIIDSLLIARYASGLLSDFPCRGFSTPPPTSQPIVFSDSAFEEVVRMEIDKLDGEIYPEDLQGITDLYLYDWPLADLNGLEYFESLERLRIDSYFNLNLQPILGLSRLTGFSVTTMFISDLSIVLEIPGLEYLYFDCPSLENRIDLEELSGLPNLSQLYINNRLQDIDWLCNLGSLVTLSLCNTQNSSLYFLRGMDELKNLYLDGNRISFLDELADRQGLENLSLNNNEISSILPLAGLDEIISLSLINNSITDISPLVFLDELEKLALSRNNISDVSLLGILSSLKELLLADNNISDVTPLMGLVELEKLDLSGNPIAPGDIAALRSALPETVVIF